MSRALAIPDILCSVFDHIAQFDCNDRLDVLLTASLVNRDWCRIAQPLLWRAPPELESFEHQERFLSATLSSSQTGRCELLGRCVRSLSLTWNSAQSHRDLIMQIAKCCPNVANLRLRRDACEDTTPDVVSYSDMEFLVQLLPTFSSLAHLSVEHYDDFGLATSTLALPDVMKFAGDTAAPRLTSLRMTGVPHLEFDIGMFRTLQTLHVSSWMRVANSRIVSLAAACPELRNLRLQWHILDSDARAFIENCPLLQSIDIIQIRESAGPVADEPGATSWIQVAAQTLPHLRSIRTNADIHSADLTALSGTAAPLETLGFNRVEVCNERELVALVLAHRRTLRSLQLLNWDALTVRGLPVGDAFVNTLASCAALETLEVDFTPPPMPELPTAPLKFVGERQIKDESILRLLDACPRLFRTDELVTLAKMHSQWAEKCQTRVEHLPEWTQELHEDAYTIMGW
ncbi:hypothetical protein BKA62DRAFT_684754 [Auriculariales sp. MPI-PUGE-AT-0066]|nr:hypothetical protein BKA62DRAFT_684754 [Auriculariales sp. MPI-PUGE-AT-0066]